MYFLNPEKQPAGNYYAPQTSSAPGMRVFPDEFMPVFYMEGKEYAGFVDITDDGVTVLSCEWNEDAYQAFLADNPPTPEPETEPEYVTYDALAAAYDEGVMSIDE